MQYFAQYDSPAGRLVLECDEEALKGLTFGELPQPQEDDNRILRAAKDWLDDYFRGIPRPADFPIAPEGSGFRKRIWELLLQIPWGETRSYGELARQAAEGMGKERMSAQAVGQAVGSNPISILIPCHRVVGAGGQMTGYAWGIEKKIWLLEHERRNLQKEE